MERPSVVDMACPMLNRSSKTGCTEDMKGLWNCRGAEDVGTTALECSVEMRELWISGEQVGRGVAAGVEATVREHSLRTATCCVDVRSLATRSVVKG